MQRRKIDEVVETYVRDRLNAECEARGRQTQIAEQIGYSSSELSLVRSGKRQLGRGMAQALAAHWGVDYETLQKTARGAHAGREPATRKHLPNLDATIAFCRGEMPAEFLESYERQARRLPSDRAKREWLTDIDGKYLAWRERQKTQKIEQQRKPTVRKQRKISPVGDRSGVLPKIRAGSDVRTKAV